MYGISYINDLQTRLSLKTIGYVPVWGHDRVFKPSTSLNRIEGGPFS